MQSEVISKEQAMKAAECITADACFLLYGEAKEMLRAAKTISLLFSSPVYALLPKKIGLFDRLAFSILGIVPLRQKTEDPHLLSELIGDFFASFGEESLLPILVNCDTASDRLAAVRDKLEETLYVVNASTALREGPLSCLAPAFPGKEGFGG